MNREEARFILSSVHPDRIDQHDSHMAEALKFAENDDELRQWLASATEFDRAVTEKMAEVEVPANLKTAITSGLRLAEGKTVSRRNALVAAASVAAMLGSAAWWLADRQSGTDYLLTRFQSDILDELLALGPLDHKTTDTDSIANWLHGHGIDPDVNVPEVIDGRQPLGCKLLEWNGRKVSLICFMKPGEEETLMHVVTLSVPTGNSDTSSQHFRDRGNLSSVVWQQGNTVYLVAALGNDVELPTSLPIL